jgi:hypothetical protein
MFLYVLVLIGLKPPVADAHPKLYLQRKSNRVCAAPKLFLVDSVDVAREPTKIFLKLLHTMLLAEHCAIRGYLKHSNMWSCLVTDNWLIMDQKQAY